MSDLEERLARLSPARREVLRRLLAERGIDHEPQGPHSEDLESAPALDANVQGSDVARFYDGITQQLNTTPFSKLALFLNYGFMPGDNRSFSTIDIPQGTVNANSIRLVLELVGDLPLRRHWNALDVGCGRGGTLWALQKYFQLDRGVGLDLSPQAVQYCRRRHADSGLSFLVGSARQLPCDDRAFDLVTNVESSHSYGDIPAFYREVRRVLRPGGWFLYTDLLPADGLDELETELRASGLSVRHRQNITDGVLRSCAHTAAGKAGAFRTEDQPTLGAFLGAPGSGTFQAMEQRRLAYMLYRLTRTDRLRGGNEDGRL